MKAILIATLAGLLLGSGSAGAAGWYFLITRSYRRARNLVVIGLSYILIGALSLGSLFLLFSFCDSMSIARHSPSDHAAKFAYAISYACVVFLVVRAELRWQTAVRLDSKTWMSNRRNSS